MEKVSCLCKKIIMNKPRIIFAGTAEFACPTLLALHEIADVILVLTQPQQPAGRGLSLKSSAVDLLAQKLKLPILRPETLKKSLFGSVIEKYPCDFLVVAAYGKIIPQWFLDWPKKAPLNVHGSILPRWRGAAPIQHALLNNDAVSGATIIQMTAGLDEGPIFALEECLILPDDDQHSLAQKVATIGASLLIKTVLNFNTSPTPQVGESCYAPKVAKTDGFVNWNAKASYIYCQYRAFKGWPGLYSFSSKGLRVKINTLQPTDVINDRLKPGETWVQDSKLFVKTSDGCLQLLDIQFEGKPPLNIHQALLDKNHWLYHQKLEFNCEF